MCEARREVGSRDAEERCERGALEVSRNFTVKLGVECSPPVQGVSAQVQFF